MDRLTARNGDIVTYMGKHTNLPGIESASSMRVPATRDVMERLAEYEDTGLTPEEIGIIKKQLLDELEPFVQTIVDAVPPLVAAVVEDLPTLVEQKIEQKIMELSRENLREN